MKTKPTDNPWAKLDALMKTEPEPMGAEWFTVGQFAARYGMSPEGSRARIHRMKAAKKLEHWKGVGGPHRRLLNKYRATP